MDSIKSVFALNRTHVWRALALYAATFAALMLGAFWHLGGIAISPWALLSALIVQLIGQQLWAFGIRTGSRRIEYIGVSLNGVSWWFGYAQVASLFHMPYNRLVIDLALAALVFGALPAAAHYLTSELARWFAEQKARKHRKNHGDRLKILVLEDFRPVGKSLKKALALHGHDVTWVVAVTNTEPGFLVGVTDDGKEISINSAALDLALVDYDLEFGLKGPQVVGAITRQNVRCVGISLASEYNAVLKRHGASLSVIKPIALAAVLKGTLDLEQVVDSDSLPEIQTKLDRFAEIFRADPEFQQEVDEFINQCIR